MNVAMLDADDTRVVIIGGEVHRTLPQHVRAQAAPTAAQRADIRDFVLERDGGRCRVCGDKATEVDHVWPESLGGPYRPMNLRAICSTCNKRKRDRPAGEQLDSQQPNCRHCRVGRAAPAHGGLCSACAKYRYRNGVLPPQRVIDRRVDRLVATTNRGDPNVIARAKGNGPTTRRRGVS